MGNHHLQHYEGSFRDTDNDGYHEYSPVDEYMNVTLGAISAGDPGNNDIEPFSSRGPSGIYTYDVSGNPIGFNDRPKPELTAIHGVQTEPLQPGNRHPASTTAIWPSDLAHL